MNSENSISEVENIYTDDKLLLLSGIQHFYYCKRQWMLIHVEQQWKENIHTFQGAVLHEKVDDPYIAESRGSYFISRSMPLVSYSLGLFGISDAVEFHKNKNGIYMEAKQDYFTVLPIEYKVGKPKEDHCDMVQLCAQAICLEEMLSCEIKEGALFYGKTRHRTSVELDETLRLEVINLCREMHSILENEINISPIYSDKCARCSMADLCIPKINKSYKSVDNYMKSYISEIEGEITEKTT